MSSDNKIEFTKENIDTYLKEVAKEYRKQIGKNMPAELTLIGGAAVLVNYGFRDMTTDIDAVIRYISFLHRSPGSGMDGHRVNFYKYWIFLCVTIL